jgi:HK97 family phage major capsid protein
MPGDIETAVKAVEDLNKAVAAERATLAELQGEVKTFAGERAETKAKLDKIQADLDTALARSEEAVLAVKRSQRVITDEHGNPVDLDAKAQEWADIMATAYQRAPFQMDAKSMAAYKAAQLKYARKGMDALEPEERKALSVGGDATGGFVVYPDMSGQIVTKVDETSPMRAYASIQVISTDALEGLFDLNRASAGWVSETGARAQTNTPDLGKWRIPVHELYAMPAATQQLLDDAAINMEAWLAAKVALEFALTENTAFVTGDGVGKPRGILSYADGTTLPGTVERFNTGADGAFAAAPNGGDVLIDALHGLKAQYRANAAWFMNRTTTKMVRKLKDSDGAYLWSPGIAAGQPATLLGYPVASFEDMPSGTTTGATAIAVADMRAAYQIVDRMGVRVLRDPYTSKPNVLFYTTKRVGGDLVNFEAIKLVEFSAS